MRRLLLADDSVTIQRVVELTFSGEDIEVVTVSDGEEAIASMSADPPDIVLADIAMPKKNGYEVAAFVKEHPTLSRVPVLLLAGAFEPVDEERAKRVKCDGVLVKPFETHEVITRVRELIGNGRQGEPATDSPRGNVVEMPPPAFHAPQAPQAPDQSLDDYFDRLDVAFATRAQTPPRPFPHLSVPGPEPAEAPVEADVSSSAKAPADRRSFAEPSTSAAGAAADKPQGTHVGVLVPGEAVKPGGERLAASGSAIADLFKQFFEVEQGERDATSIRIPDEIARIRRGNTIE
jgi:CheY-like chemotaxis protein